MGNPTLCNFENTTYTTYYQLKLQLTIDIYFFGEPHDTYLFVTPSSELRLTDGAMEIGGRLYTGCT